MATIYHSDIAPRDEEVTYSLAGAEPFTLKGDDGYDTDDQEMVSNAIENPWLRVEGTVGEEEAADEAPVDVDYPKTALDAGLDQNEVVYEGDGEIPIAETLAADEAQGDDPIVVDEPEPEPVKPEPKPAATKADKAKETQE